MEYNTSRNKLLMPEYGRNIQTMVDYILTIEDPEKRQRNAQAIIEMMGILNPHLKNVEDFRHKLWDHLFIISDFKIEVESPYPLPTREKIFQKPAPLPYPSKNKKNKHLGKNISKIIDRAMETSEEEKKRGFTQAIAYYMKLSYANWHKEQVQDDMIKEELKVLSNGHLDYTPGDVRLRFNTSNFKKHGQNQKRHNSGSNNNNNNKANRNNPNNPHYKNNKQNNRMKNN